MKKYIVLLIIVSIGLTSCDKDNDETPSNSQSINFTQAYLSNLGGTPCLGCNIITYDFQLSLLGADMTVDIASGQTSGDAPIIRLEFYSETEGTPKAGIYKDFGNSVVPYNLTWGAYQTSELGTIDSDYEYYQMDYTKSSLEISYTGSQMIIDYDIHLIGGILGELDGNLNIKGKWDNDLTIINDKLF